MQKVLGILIIVDMCGIGAATGFSLGGCIVGIGVAALLDVVWAEGSTLGQLENAAGVISLSATAVGNFFDGSSYISHRDDGGINFGIGLDTLVSFSNTLSGFIPESNFDFLISVSQLEYDTARMSGKLPSQTAFEINIPGTLNLWGPNQCNGVIPGCP